MKRVRVRSMEDFEALPEGEWVEVLGGMKFDVKDDSIRVEDDRLVVPLSQSLRRAFKARPGERFEARMSGGRLIVERRRRQPRRT